MRSARAVLPIDLPALVSHNAQLYPNEAWPRESLGSSSMGLHPIETALEHWFSFGNGRSAWIMSAQGRLSGFVSVRRRGGRQAWEIDRLVDTTSGLDALPELLDRAIVEAGRCGAEKLFVRLAADSDLLPTLRAAGFHAYATETLYRSETLPASQTTVPLRDVSRQDLYPTFRLYCSVFPEARRRQEAATFSEWQASLESHWARGGVHMVGADEARPGMQVQAARLASGISMELLMERPDRDSVAALIAVAAGRCGGDPPLLVLAESEGPLASPLEALGFDARASYVSLVRRTTRVVRLPKTVQQIAKTAVVT